MTHHRPRIIVLLAVATAAVLLTAGCRSTAVASAGHSSPPAPATTVSAAAPDPSAGSATASAPDSTTSAPADTATATAGAPVAGGCLISASEAAQAFGHDAGRPTGNASGCSYALGGLLHVFATSYGANAMVAYTNQRTAASGLPNFQDVNGVGDHAFVSWDNTQSIIELVSGSTVVIIQVAVSPQPTLAILTSLGQDAAGRL